MTNKIAIWLWIFWFIGVIITWGHAWEQYDCSGLADVRGICLINTGTAGLWWPVYWSARFWEAQ